MAYPDYYVSAVNYNSDNTHISKLRVHAVNQENGNFNVGKFEDLTRPQVIELIRKKKTFTTIVKKDNKWSLGAKLEIISVTTDYLKTKNDSSTKDNLENLPTI
ncbi:hypothetical protein DA83_16060 [Pseudomonas sp. 250J]|uniref:DUF3892 domain-containing protein n=1 Tax=Pseudomonas sp. 250J TaxID=1478142 RepID=UPI00068285DD|nr:DUF3892 domain-containing protein [Pseudomonas sp. 250J]KNX80644.1 hypothetical protein DA83_16060 [Pseudomonas sp. 250J]